MHEQSNIPALKSASTLQRVLLQAAVLKKLNGAHKEFKDQVALAFAPGEKVEITNAQSLKLGSASMSQPSKTAVCKDEAVMLAMADDRGMEIVDALPRNDSEKGQAAIDYLLEHAPHLLDSSVTSDDAKTLATEVFESWQVTGELPLGWEIKEASDPQFSVTPGRTKPAVAAIDHLVAQITNLMDTQAIEEGK